MRPPDLVQQAFSKLTFFAAILVVGIAPAIAQPSLQLTKSPDGAVIPLGSTATFTLEIRNNGTTDLENPQLVDELPGDGGIVWQTADVAYCTINGLVGDQTLECDFSTLAPGKSVTVSVFGIPQSCVTLNNTATATSNSLLTPQGERIPVVDSGTITVACAMFVIGDLQPHLPGSVVNFWGAQWWKNNPMTGPVDNGVASFKGYATDASLSCGATWRSRPGNSSQPLATLPEFMMIIVTDRIQKAGSDISGRIKEIIEVHPDRGYGPSPGHRGNGAVTKVLCALPPPP
jgi:uncharacterized repeat protein (TIGR01451 family)